jgi:hypothetical protein
VVSDAWLETQGPFDNGHPASALLYRKIKRENELAFRNYATRASLMRTVDGLIYLEIPNNIQQHVAMAMLLISYWL